MGWDSIAVDRWGNNYQLWSTNAEVQGKEITDKYMVPANVDTILGLYTGGGPDFTEDITIDGDLAITGSLSVGVDADIAGDLTAKNGIIKNELEVYKSVKVGLEDGDEMISNGTFDSDLTEWNTNTATQSAGVASIPYEGKLSQAITLLEGITYRIKYDITASVLGSESPGPGISKIGIINTMYIASDSFDSLRGTEFRPETVTGSFDFIVTAYQDYDYFSIFNDTVGSTMTIDNISIRKASYYTFGYNIVANGNFPYDSQNWNILTDGDNTQVFTAGTGVAITCASASDYDDCGLFKFIDVNSIWKRLVKGATYIAKYTLTNSSGAAAEPDVYVGFTDDLGENIWTTGVQRFTGESATGDHEVTVVADDSIYAHLAFTNRHEGNTLSISNVSLIRITEHAGDITAGGDLTIGGDATFNGSLILPHSVSAPSDPVEGQIYVDTILDGLYVYSESSWRAIVRW